MKQKSLQDIQNEYEQRGFRGSSLRLALQKDKEYVQILTKRKKKLRNKLKIQKFEEKKYVLSTDLDYDILAKIKFLEKQKLTHEHKEIILLLRTQLEHDWRKPLQAYLQQMVKKYASTKKLNK